MNFHFLRRLKRPCAVLVSVGIALTALVAHAPLGAQPSEAATLQLRSVHDEASTHIVLLDIDVGTTTLAAFQATLRYDPSVLRTDDCEFAASDALGHCNASEPGIVKLGAFSPVVEGFGDRPGFVTIAFSPQPGVGRAITTAVTLNVLVAVDSLIETLHDVPAESTVMIELGSSGAAAASEPAQPVGTLSGRVTTADDGPVFGVEVCAIGFLIDSQSCAYSASDGRFVIDELDIGNYRVVANDLGGRYEDVEHQRAVGVVADRAVVDIDLVMLR